MTINWSKLSKTLKPKTIGMLEEVSLPMFGVDDITAKVDTGAYSGSLHATSIKELVKDKSKVLSFKPHGKTTAVTVNKFHSRRVKSSSGHISTRYAIDTEVVIRGKKYPITITLSDRSSMKYPMLIGRKFLRTHGFLVDVTINNK